MFSNSSNVRSLLRDEVGGGHPREYVLARLRGRRAALNGAAPPTTAAVDGGTDDYIWRGFLDEQMWLFRQMDERLRVAAAPLFGLFEMKTIVLCLRYAALDRAEQRRRLLDGSLLSSELRAILGRDGPVGAIVGALSGALGGFAPALLDLDSRYFESGLKGCEDALVRVYLEAVSASRAAPATRSFLMRFTDFRNLMALYKHLRWDLKGPVVIIRGGSIDTTRLRKIAAREDRAALDALIASAAGIRITGAASEIGVETQLLGALGAQLRRERRERGPDWAVPEYMWSAYVHARNLALLHHGSGLEPQRLAREIIA